ncbi:transcription factor HHO3-like [Bidens hawaiensis]|uniref:transcription factor HHO3-like n=1 Tax=Bidens hawaiensis TaxID=980011 RepID=UPI00404ADD89
MVIDNNPPSDLIHNMQRCQEYMKALESERTKIQVFERELPLCLNLVTQAIEGCKRQLSGTTSDYLNGQSDCSEQTSSDGPVLEQFIPIKRNEKEKENEDYNDEVDEDCQGHQELINNNNKSNIISKKSDWLRSAQLSIQTPAPVEVSPKIVSVVEVKRNGCGAFHPFKKEKCSGEAPANIQAKLFSMPTVDTMTDTSSTANTGNSGGGSKGEDKGQINRKARRNWSPELHRRFLHALQELGGAHVATPKQIRELMKVDGLTNDEVKSHLQKYRLHTRRSSPPNHNITQTPQFVVVGGLWMPPPEYNATMTANSTPTSDDTNNSKGVYVPVASHPPSKVDAFMSLNKTNSGEKDCGHSNNNSPSISSSTHTTTASPVF